MEATSEQLSSTKRDLKSIFDLAKLNKTKLAMMVGITALLGILVYYLYIHYVKPKLNPSYVENKEFLPVKEDIPEEDVDADLILFHATWCPHSKTTVEKWNQIKPNYDNKTKNKRKIIMKEVDCDKEESIANEYNITSYPTIKLVKSSDEIIEYDAKLEEETLNEFLETTL